MMNNWKTPAVGYWRLIALFLLGAVLAAASAVLSSGSSSAEDASLPNATVNELADAGITVTVAKGESTTISADTALRVATEREIKGAPALDVQLVRVTNARFSEQLSWAVSLDPATVAAILPSGPPECHNVPDGDASFILDFVDAQTGDWMFELRQSRFKPSAGPDGVIPEHCKIG